MSSNMTVVYNVSEDDAEAAEESNHTSSGHYEKAPDGSFRWPAPDRDSPQLGTFSGEYTPDEKIGALLQMGGLQGRSEAEILKKTGVEIKRPRRWHKIFERMGILYPGNGATKLGRLGRILEDASHTDGLKRVVAREALEVLRRYQINNPIEKSLPLECSVHPYWVILRAASQLDWKIHWDEVNRELMRMTTDNEIDIVVNNIKKARENSQYEDFIGKASNDAGLLRARTHQADVTAPENKSPEGQLRDQRMTPFLKRAGFSELLLTSPGASGAGYWSVPIVLRELVSEATSTFPLIVEADTEEEWNNWFYEGQSPKNNIDPFLDGKESKTALESSIAETDPVLDTVREIQKTGGTGVLFSGPPGTSKTWYARQVAIKLVDGDPSRLKFVQFHPSMSYDDFVEGYVPVARSGGSTFDVKKKILLQLAEHAKNVAPSLCVLVIDELNRGDTSRIFGELLTYIESGYRDIDFVTAYSGSTTSIPRNLFIIGTYNPFDKSVVELDDAMDRRFERISFDPSPIILSKLLKDAGVNNDLVGRVIPYFVTLNKLTRHGIGHALFLNVRDDSTLRTLWNRKLKFILEKHFRFEPDSFAAAKAGYLDLFSDKDAAGI